MLLFLTGHHVDQEALLEEGRPLIEGYMGEL